MQSRQLHYRDGEIEADLTITQASYAQDLQHAALVSEALQREPQVAEGLALYQRNARAFVLPALQAATLTATLTQAGQTTALPIESATIFDLPADLIDQWINAVYDLNPRWNPFREDDAGEREKKA